MSEQFAHGVDVHSEREHHSGKSMTAAVKGDVLVNTQLLGHDSQLAVYKSFIIKRKDWVRTFGTTSS